MKRVTIIIIAISLLFSPAWAGEIVPGNLMFLQGTVWRIGPSNSQLHIGFIPVMYTCVETQVMIVDGLKTLSLSTSRSLAFLKRPNPYP